MTTKPKIARAIARTVAQKSPSNLPKSSAFTETQRKNLCLGRPVAPRVRAAGEAPSVTVCNGSMTALYQPGDGDVGQPARPGADDHLAHPSRYMERRSWRDGRVTEQHAVVVAL